MTEKFEINNIVRIGNRDKRELYAWAILLRSSPHVYDKKGHKCIIIQVRESLVDFAETIIKKFRWLGLKEESRQRKEYEVDAGYTLKDAWEIVLVKHPALTLLEEE